MSERSAFAVTPRVVLGLGLIVMGVIFTLDNLGFGDLWTFAWPALLMVVGLSKILWPASGSSRRLGFLIMAIGALFLLGDERLGILHFDFWDLMPLILVLIGLSVVWGGMFGRLREEVDNPATLNAMALLGGAKPSTGSDAFQGGDLIAFMGAVEVDLTRARIAHSPAVIDAFAMWGGVEIRVPKDWSVRVKGVPLLGAYEDNSTQPEVDAGELIVKGFAVMGGVEVKN